MGLFRGTCQCLMGQTPGPRWTTGRSNNKTSYCEIRKVRPKIILARLLILQARGFPGYRTLVSRLGGRIYTTQRLNQLKHYRSMRPVVICYLYNTLNLCFRDRRIVWRCFYFSWSIQSCDTGHLKVYQYLCRDTRHIKSGQNVFYSRQFSRTDYSLTPTGSVGASIRSGGA